MMTGRRPIRSESRPNQSDRAGAHAQARRVHRQKRNHDPEAEQVEKDGCEENQARFAAGRRAGREWLGWLRSRHLDLAWARDEGNRMAALQSSKRGACSLVVIRSRYSM
jgi:hypothetical protein